MGSHGTLTKVDGRGVGWVRDLLGRVHGDPRAEREICQALDSLTGEGYRVFHDVTTPAGTLDHVVVGPSGVYAVHTKPWTGRIRPGRTRKVTHRGLGEGRALRQVEAEAKALRSQLGRQGMPTWVHAIIVLTRGKVPVGALRVERVIVVECGKLVSHIRRQRPYLSEDDIEQAASVVGNGRR